MRTNTDGLSIIKYCEGLSLYPYRCPAGVWTIGYGHTHGITEETAPITEDEAEDILRDDLQGFESSVSHLVQVPVDPDGDMFSALVSFTFNLGPSMLASSTLLRKLNREDYFGAAAEFRKWRLAGGEVLKGLVIRRRMEEDLFLRPFGAVRA